MAARLKGSVNVSLNFRLTDAATNLAKTGVAATGLTVQYARTGFAPSSAPAQTALALTTTAFTSGKAIEVDATNSPGIYRVDVPNAAFAGGADEVTITVIGTGCEPSSRTIDLLDVPTNAPQIRCALR